jgi:hypothetical protein
MPFIKELQHDLRLKKFATGHCLNLSVVKIGICNNSRHRTYHLFQNYEVCRVVVLELFHHVLKNWRGVHHRITLECPPSECGEGI